MPTRQRSRRAPPPARPTPAQARALLLDIEPEPVWQAWLALSPGERLIRAWAMRRRIPDLQAAHDARSLPTL